MNTEKSAELSPCGRFRWKLTRGWDKRPPLLVILFNPSTASDLVDDQTITLLCYVASWNGYGSITVVNLLPLRSSMPLAAAECLSLREHAEPIARNLAVLVAEAAKAPAILLGWGALAELTPGHDKKVLETVRRACPHAKFYCLGVTDGGHPLHPMARGKRKVSKTAKFQVWPFADGAAQ